MATVPRMTGATSIRAMTYNIRQALGVDGQRRPDRILRILNEARADLIALQEVSDPTGQAVAGEPLRFYSRETGLLGIAAPTNGQGARPYGNVLLSKWPILESQAIDLTVSGREPRNAIRAILQRPNGRVRVIATHLGLSLGERRIQTNALATLVAEDLEIPTILLGDLNEWRGRSRRAWRFARLLETAEQPRSFPSRWPVLPLDQIWTRHHRGHSKVFALRTGEAGIASDHLPVIADIKLAAA